MSRFSLTHLLDGEVVRGLKVNLAKERDALADVLAHIAEVDARKLYVPAGYESMHDYCVRGLHLSKDSTEKRIHAARAALEFPAIFERVAQGALGLSAVNELAPYLTQENAAELLAATAFKPRRELREILATRFPQAAVPTTIEPIAQPLTLAAEAEAGGPGAAVAGLEPAPARVQGVVSPLEVMPLAEDLWKMQFTMTGAMHAKLRRAVELFGRRKPVPNEAEILELGLDLLVERLEKKKFHATDKPGPRRPCAADHIPAEVQRIVRERDGGQCTFVSTDGVRCAARMDLQDDHIIPLAKGGRSDDPNNIRLRCHAHNQYEAERAFGKSFMAAKREKAHAAEARRRMEKEAERERATAAAAQRKSEKEAQRAARESEKSARAAEKQARATEKAARRAAEEALDNDEAMPGLLGLGCSVAQARSTLTEVGPTPHLDLAGRIKRCLTVAAIQRGLLRPTAAMS